MSKRLAEQAGPGRDDFGRRDGFGAKDPLGGLLQPGGTAKLLRKPWVMNLFRLLLTVLTLGMIGWYLHTRPSMDFSGFNLRWDRLALAAACLPPLLWLRAAKWRILIRAQAPSVTLMESLRSYLGSMALALVTPGRVGELSRGLYLPHRALQGWKCAGLVLVDSWTDLLAVAAWSCLGFLVVWGAGGLAAGLALVAVLAPLPLWLKLGPPVLARLPSRWGFRAWAVRTLPAPGDIPGRDLAMASLLGIAAYGLEWLQILFILEGLISVHPSPWQLAGMMALASLANSVQVTLGGLGVREGMALLLAGKIGIGPEAAVVGAFLQSVLTLFLPALAGLAVKPVALLQAPLADERPASQV